MIRRANAVGARAARLRVSRCHFMTLAAWAPALVLVCCLSILAGPPLEFDDAHELFFNAGFKWKLHEQWTFLAAAGRTIHEPRCERAAVFSYLGFQLVF